MILNLGLDNEELYDGIKVETVGGRKTMELSNSALEKLAENTVTWMITVKDKNEITITGAAPIPVYMVVFQELSTEFFSILYKNDMYELVIK